MINFIPKCEHDIPIEDCQRCLLADNRKQTEEIARLTKELADCESDCDTQADHNIELTNTIVQQAERIKVIQKDYEDAAAGYVDLSEQLAAANALLASKDALIEQAKKLLQWIEKYVSCAINGSIKELLAAIEQHQKGEK
jgi:chromosome segregation ATPase